MLHPAHGDASPTDQVFALFHCTSQDSLALEEEPLEARDVSSEKG
jgi:hypothetical protein